jgi:26S proteasome regulatory subunit (ATPase 3-interacting protein)
MTDEEMVARIRFLGSSIASAEERLVALRSGTRRVDPAEKAQVDKLHDLYMKEWRSRRKLCNEMIGAITENLPQSPAAFMEELGMETDPK